MITILLIFIMMIGILLTNNHTDYVLADSVSEDKVDCSPEDNVFIKVDGENVDTVSMEIDDKISLTTDTTIKGDIMYGWEILVDFNNNEWVSIYDCNESNIVVSYGMISSFLDENNLAQIRAVVVDGEDTYISDRVLIEVKETVKNIESEEILYNIVNYNEENVTEIKGNETVTFTINYLKYTGEQICDPYIATIFKGMHFKTTVLSPVVVGYEPKFSAEDMKLVEEYTFDYDSVSENVIVNIYYFPIEVRYEVRYYFQGIYDDEYTMNSSPVVAYGEVGTEPDKSLVEAEFEGFTRVNYQPELIAADGSTVFQCFYDREYYLVDLDLDGGHGTDSVYAKYGTAFVVNEPKKAGWIFRGWDSNGDGVADALPSTVPAENTSYKSLWNTTETTYTVVYWLENANDNHYSYVGSRLGKAVSSTLVSGSDDLTNSQVCGIEEHIHSKELGCYTCEGDTCPHDKFSCYSRLSPALASSQTNTYIVSAFNTIKNTQIAEEGYVYRYRRSGNTSYNFFYVGGEWYFLGSGTGTTVGGVTSDITTPTYTYGTTRSGSKAEVNNCSSQTHDHTSACTVCEKEEHSHDEKCKVDTTYFEYVTADKDVVVNGDGSSIVNVYYTRKKYTLRFHYARSNGSGSNTVYEVVGGTTYPFGALYSSTNENTSVQTLLEGVTQWGRVESEPTVKDSVKDNYTLGTVKYGNYTYYYLEFTEKYGSDIGDMWAIDVFNPVKIVGKHSQCNYEYAYFSAWNGEYRVKYTQDNKSLYGGNETIKGCYMHLDENIIFDSKFRDVPYVDANGKNSNLVSFLGFWDNGANISWSIPELYRYNLMVESLDGDGYKLYKSFDTYDDSDVAHQTATNIKGMTYTGYDSTTISDGSNGLMQEYSINFYYSRNEYDLSFYNYNSQVSTNSISYGDSLENTYFVPDYPSTLEENAYEFGGWYTTSGCYDGSEFDFNGSTMPANDLVLYAKWKPVTHTVTFYNTYQDLVNDSSLKVVPVSHGDVLRSDDVPETSNQGYTAGEWFYIKNGEKVAYRPISIAIKSDLKVYRDWSSSVVVEYTVHYYKIGTTEKVADSSSGWMFDGTTKTFKAKGGGELAELYEDYNEGWYPTVSSTSIVADKDGDNVVVFYYDYQNPNPYTVRYVDSDTGIEIADSKNVLDNAKSVVSEVYKPIDGYMPDAYFKQLVLSLNKEGDADKNIITFYYSKASNSAYYAVEYYFMNTDGKTYSLNARIQSPITIGSAAIIPEVSDKGYIFKKCLVRNGNEDEFKELSESGMNNIVVNEDGSLIRIYYDREKTSYTVHYYLSGTTTALKEDKVVKNIYFGTVVTEESEEKIENYSLVGEMSQTKELLFDSSYNEFIFYYDETLKTAKYMAVCKTAKYSDMNFGFVSQTQDIKKWSQKYDKVTATAMEGFRFVGWYSDKGLNSLVTTDATVIPESDTDITYYALFEPILTNLTIYKKVENSLINQTFMFRVEGLETINKDIDITVTVHGNDKIKVCSLPVGNYRVTEDINWSWKYKPVGENSKEIDLVLDESVNIIEFTNSLWNSNWLSGEHYSVNIFK